MIDLLLKLLPVLGVSVTTYIAAVVLGSVGGITSWRLMT